MRQRHMSGYQLRMERRKWLLVGGILIAIGLAALVAFFVRGGF